MSENGGRLQRKFTGRMDVLASFVGYSRLGQSWRRDTFVIPERTIQPDASFHLIREDTLALLKKGLIREVGHYRYAVTDAGITEWNRLWPEHPARTLADKQ